MLDKGKTILILGNGFDLANGLPTKYSHFLDFCQRVERIWIDNWETDATVKDTIVTEFSNRKIKIDPAGIRESPW